MATYTVEIDSPIGTAQIRVKGMQSASQAIVHVEQTIGKGQIGDLDVVDISLKPGHKWDVLGADLHQGAASKAWGKTMGAGTTAVHYAKALGGTIITLAAIINSAYAAQAAYADCQMSWSNIRRSRMKA